ncbi:RCC1 domain-containing protein [Chondromyces apiculatus]|uniref:Regulator of chromosome condensation, RCC1 n=1 Tax=Chondromyces apiculatus DSM 436 TaxID=1192034 RepID=A0A017T042_9BACT|nr:hypothetical protein [Chondromyces apiculatus]EYF01931.1 regulator of chromosome condensation, RCC1 [Chondromyces apiculatus DSM 436]
MAHPGVRAILLVSLAACGGPGALPASPPRAAPPAQVHRAASPPPPSSTSTPAPLARLGSALRVVAGSAHTCVLGSEGVVRCLGSNESGQLAPRSPKSATVADTVLPERIVDVAAGDGFTCALGASGTVQCWGWIFTDHPSTGAKTIKGIGGATAIVARGSSGCAVLAEGDAACWGYGPWGQEGDQREDAMAVRLGLRDVASVSADERYLCVTLKSGAAQCMGALPWREEEATSWVPIAPPKGTKAAFRGVSTASSHACFTTDAEPLCLDDTGGGDAGGSSRVPLFARRAQRLQVHHQRTCALGAAGRVACWGGGAGPALGIDPDAPIVDGVVPVVGVSDAIDLALSSGHTCALDARGDVSCWGSNTHGQLGDGQPIYRPSPVDTGVVPGLEDIQGGLHETCWLAEGKISCRGGKDDLGPWPQQARMLDRVAAMDLGQSTVCGLLVDGDVSCGMFLSHDRCKDGEDQRHCVVEARWDRDTLPRLPGKATAMAVDRVGNVCAVVNGAAHCLFHLGEAGGYHDDAWQKIPGISGATAVTASVSTMCFIQGKDRHLACFHDDRFDADQDFAQTPPRPRVARVEGLTGVDTLAAGVDRFCAIAGGALRCFEPTFQTGDPPTLRTTSPRPIKGLPRADAIAGEDDMFCAISQGKVHCWGRGQHQPGLTYQERAAMFARLDAIPLPRPATHVGVGYDHACASTDDQHLWCWGLDDGGQLGAGRVAVSFRPVRAVVFR